MRKIIKSIYLDFIRKIFFRILFFLTRNLRKSAWDRDSVKNILIFGLNRIGDNALSIPFLKSIRQNFGNSNIVIISNRYVKDIFEIEASVDKILFYKNENILGKVKTLFYSITRKWDLGIDLTCDYSFFPALFLFVSKAKFRIGFDIKDRGFLFQRPLRWEDSNKHFTERLLDILRALNLEIENNGLKLEISEALRKKAKSLLESRGIFDKDLLIGIHPGGYYPSQRWPLERFIRVGHELVNRYKAKIIMMDDSNKLMLDMAYMMREDISIFCNIPLRDLIGILSRCNLVICNNSGILHLACALGVPTVSTMGPTNPKQWWPLGENNIVLKKDLPCLSCEKGFCKTHECMDLIGVEEMLEAVDKQIKRLGK